MPVQCDAPLAHAQHNVFSSLHIMGRTWSKMGTDMLRPQPRPMDKNVIYKDCCWRSAVADSGSRHGD